MPTLAKNFPLRLQSGVTVQGAVATNLGSTVIRGNGTLVAANGNYLQVAIVGVDGAGLANVTVTNPSSSGYGLVVEAGRPIIRFNRFFKQWLRRSLRGWNRCTPVRAKLCSQRMVPWACC